MNDKNIDWGIGDVYLNGKKIIENGKAEKSLTEAVKEELKSKDWRDKHGNDIQS